ncbi:MAG TPA: hypothetical protein VGO90_14425 [Chthoniobacteraceae bacterium]|jgi:cell division protein FtsB|nr:hypothetical protein [Chthoniobacteraceae bacterium]
MIAFSRSWYFALIALATTASAQAPAEITPAELAKLRERLTQLEAETKALNKELEELRAGQGVIEPRPRGEVIEPQPGWERREYNGGVYYMVPLTPAGR